ncbi:Na+/H+ antiporter subunit B [Myroides indicus]|uniref:Multisubunit sodium/proton antiporter MrpB subunit n=1 Tax=Myroides indicus TaxID=1323422 RepID=A0A4R7EZ47_9FLAO|nr:Na+/H+ antiporter subunit B [Myroides indicus]TDS60191.1 multisubunit sodium/proton antiporter MrpB subunit [Myroides indicus]
MKRYRSKKEQDQTILRTATNYLLPVLLLFSVFVLLRGHYLSGGGFVGGLIASIAFVLHSFAYSTKQTLSLFQFSPMALIPAGLALSILSGLLPVLLGLPFMTGVWFADSVAVIGSVGTALFFDIGVYLVVIGVVLTILFTIAENV